jgi:hypothetical protein
MALQSQNQVVDLAVRTSSASYQDPFIPNTYNWCKNMSGEAFIRKWMNNIFYENKKITKKDFTIISSSLLKDKNY